MLASTVQFSNNDQPPTTPETHPEFTGAGTEDISHAAVPSDTQQRARHNQPNQPAFHAQRAVLTADPSWPRRVVNVPPMSKPASDTR